MLLDVPSTGTHKNDSLINSFSSLQSHCHLGFIEAFRQLLAVELYRSWLSGVYLQVNYRSYGSRIVRILRIGDIHFAIEFPETTFIKSHVQRHQH